MKLIGNFPRRSSAALLLIGVLTGCQSTGGGQVSGSVYYGTGFNDPWYYGPGYYPPDIVVTPPPRPGVTPPPRPQQPIAKPLPAPAPRPSIPSTPRPARRR
jgi:hypothetical protein